MRPAHQDDLASVRAWVRSWGAEVASVEIDAARGRFSPAVAGFGTHAEVVEGLEALVEQQWRNVWPAIEGFAFRLDELHVIISPDRRLAVAFLPWRSTGFGPDGAPFDRPGRATIALQRDDLDQPWTGVHTHFSLAPGVPARSYPRGSRS